MNRYGSYVRNSLFALGLLALGSASCSGPVEGSEEADELGSVSRSQSALLSTCAGADAVAIDSLKELMIVHPSVVESPEASNATNGPLSFRAVMTKLAGAQDVAEFTERWLKTWMTAQTVGGVTSTVRGQVDDLLQPFRSRSWPRDASGKLDMAQSPWRLLAIANRMDLFGTAAGKPNGEARLVYGLTGPDAKMAIIFEFNLPATQSLRSWANRWHKLGSLPFGPSFNTALVNDVVNQFVAPQNLSQLRTNERIFLVPWNMREFNLVNGSLALTTVKQTPHISFNGSDDAKVTQLVNWIKANQHDIVSNTHVIPPELSAVESVANTPANETPQTFHGSAWLIRTAPTKGLSESLRHDFAKQTCNGCHNSDIGASLAGTQFYHVNPERELIPGFPGGDGTARLSPFVLNTELPARKKVLAGLLACKCVSHYRVRSRTATGTTSSVTVRNISGAKVNRWNVAWTYASTERVVSNTASILIPQAEPNKFQFKNAAENGWMVNGGTRTFVFDTVVTGTAPAPIPAQIQTTCE